MMTTTRRDPWLPALRAIQRQEAYRGPIRVTASPDVIRASMTLTARVRAGLDATRLARRKQQKIV